MKDDHNTYLYYNSLYISIVYKVNGQLNCPVIDFRNVVLYSKIRSKHYRNRKVYALTKLSSETSSRMLSGGET